MALSGNVPSIPPVPPNQDPQLTGFLRALRDACMTRFGLTENFLDSSPTYRNLADEDIIRLGLLGRNGVPTTIYTPGGPDDPDTYDPFTDQSVPEAPTNVTVTSSIFKNFISWTIPATSLSIVAFTEVWANDVDDRDTASFVGTGYQSFTHSVDPASTTYYWVRFRSYANIEGLWNAIAGTPGTTSEDPQALLDLLNGYLGESQLNALLSARIAGGGQFIEDNFDYNSATTFDQLWTEIQKTGDAYSVINGTGTFPGEGLYALEAGDNSGTDDLIWRGLDQSLALAVGDSDIFRISAWVRRTQGTGTIYVGVNGYKGDVTNGNGTLVNVNGADGFGGQHYFGTNIGYNPPDTDWHYVEGYFWRDNVAQAYATGDMADPHVLHPDVEYVAPMFILNYDTGSTGTGTAAIKNIRLERVGGVEVTNTLNRYTVKIDSDGYVAGYGLAVDPNDGVPTSDFIINVDNFFIKRVGATELSFAVSDGKVVMDAAFIKAASITTAQIDEISASKISTGTVSADVVIGSNFTLNGGALSVGKTSANSAVNGIWIGTDGGSFYDLHIGNNVNRIWWDGSEGTLDIRGQLNADDISSGTMSADRINLGADPGISLTSENGVLVIQSGAVDTPELALNSATASAQSNTALVNVPTGSNSNWVQIQSLTVSSVIDSISVRIDVNALISREAGDNARFYFAIYRGPISPNGVLLLGGDATEEGLVQHVDLANRSTPFAFSVTDSPGAGSHTYYFYMKTTQSTQEYDVYQPTIQATQFKR